MHTTRMYDFRKLFFFKPGQTPLGYTPLISQLKMLAQTSQSYYIQKLKWGLIMLFQLFNQYVLKRKTSHGIEQIYKLDRKMAAFLYVPFGWNRSGLHWYGTWQ